VLVAAEDRYGNSKLDYLKYLLLGAFLGGTALVWAVSFYVSRRNLAPLDKVTRQIREITGRNLTVRLPQSGSQDEINDLSGSFNQMMDRIDRAYSSQKEFTANASHELRTPLARMIAQLENLLKESPDKERQEAVLRSIAEDSYLLSDIVTSLLLLSEMESSRKLNAFKPVRLDEVVFLSAARLVKSYPRFRLQFEIEHSQKGEINLEVAADETLLAIAVGNLLKNAYLYSTTGVVQCTLREGGEGLQLVIVNRGPVPEVADTATLFQTFTRGSNSTKKTGSGIGLSIVNRIMNYHAATLKYHVAAPDTNEVVLTFGA
jgi:two-component system sensor histidine kinase ArlS